MNNGITSAPDIDLTDPEVYERGVPHEVFAWLRDHDPVHWNPGRPSPGLRPDGKPIPDQRGFWAITRFEDVKYVSLHPELFSSELGGTQLADLHPDALRTFRMQMNNMDGAHHLRVRKIVSKAFTATHVRRMEHHIRELTDEILDRVAPLGRCELVTEVAAELPLLVLAKMLGVPDEDRGKLFEWTNWIVDKGAARIEGDRVEGDRIEGDGVEGDEGGEHSPEPDGGKDSIAPLLDMCRYANRVGAAKREKPDDSLVSDLVHAEIDGEQLSPEEFMMFFALLVIAGNETTRNAISGGLLALCEHPRQMERLCADPQLIPSATEEILRWVSPVIQFRRTATRDTEIAGRPIREGDKVVMFYPSANRDPRAFDDPERFDVARDPNPHLAFGIGTHFCLGANLARAEVSTMLAEVLRRLRGIEVDGMVERVCSNTFNGIRKMPVRFAAETAA